MFPHCFKIPPKYIVLFKGDDSDFDGNQEVAIDIGTELPLEGMKAHFRFLDFSQDFDSIPEDRRLLLVFPREKTMKFPLGAMDAALTFEDSQGRIRTIANRIHIVVTSSVEEAYWNKETQAITVVMSGDEYLKNAEVSEDGKTLTITKKDGTQVQFRGGGGGGGAVDSVNGETGDVVLTADKINIDPDLEVSTKDAIQALFGLNAETVENLNGHTNNRDNPHQVTAGQVGTYTSQEIDDKITRFSAHYLTADSEGHPFATDTALNTAQKFYYAGEEFTPTKNDYCVVLADETVDGKTTRYSYVGDWPTGAFQYQYTINDTAFSEDQWNAINSGATAEKIGAIAEKQDALSSEQIAVVNGGPYLPTTGGTILNPTKYVPTRLDIGGKFGEGQDSSGHLVIYGGEDSGTEILGGLIEVEGERVYGNGIIVNGEHVATENQLRITMQLVGNDPYTVKLDGEEQTFAEIKELAQTRNAVIQRGQGTYRVTYIGSNEMMWDVTGTVQGDVLTGQIHIFDQNGETVVQRVEPKTLATKPMVDAVDDKVEDIKATVSTDNRFLVNGTTAAIQTRENEGAEWVNQIRIDKGYDALTGSTMVKLDKSVQTVTVAGSNLVIEIPESVDGTVRDLCVYANNSSDADTALTFPAGTYYGDDPNGAVAKAGKVTAIYLTEIPKGVWMLRIEELEQHEVVA